LFPNEVLLIYDLSLINPFGDKYEFSVDIPKSHSYVLTMDNGYMHLVEKKRGNGEQQQPVGKQVFSRSPMGVVQRNTGTLFLFDLEGKGCVYTVLGFGRPSLRNATPEGERM